MLSGGFKLVAAGILTLALTACTTPSTMMVNRDGKVLRCSSYGYGNLVAIGAAEGIHSSCVRDARMVGFEPIPPVTTGINYDPKSMPVRVTQVAGPAQAAGVKVGDIVVEFEGKPVEDHMLIVRYLNTKRAGESVTVKVRRGDELLSFPLTLVNR